MNTKNNKLCPEKTSEEKIEQLENLHLAILDEDLAAVRKLIAEGVNVNDTSVKFSGKSAPLASAFFKQNVEIIKELLSAGADPLTDGGYYDDTLYLEAIKQDNFELMKLLFPKTTYFSCGVDYGFAMQYACETMNYGCIVFFLKKGINFHKYYYEIFSEKYNAYDMVFRNVDRDSIFLITKRLIETEVFLKVEKPIAISILFNSRHYSGLAKSLWRFLDRKISYSDLKTYLHRSGTSKREILNRETYVPPIVLTSVLWNMNNKILKYAKYCDFSYKYDETSKRIIPSFKFKSRLELEHKDRLEFLNETKKIQNMILRDKSFLSKFPGHEILNSCINSLGFKLMKLLLVSGIELDASAPNNRNIFHQIFSNPDEFFDDEFQSVIHLLETLRSKIGDDRFYKALHKKDNDGFTPLDICASDEQGMNSTSLNYLTTFVTAYSLKTSMAEVKSQTDSEIQTASRKKPVDIL